MREESSMIVDPLPKPPALDGRIEAQLSSCVGIAQVNRYSWRESREALFKPDTPIIDVVLARRGADLEGSFVEGGRELRRRAGDIIFMPPEYTLHSRWKAGDRRSMCCVFNRDAYSDLLDVDWHDRKLAASLNVENGYIRSLMLRMVNEVLEPGFASALLVELLATALLVEIRRHFDRLDYEDPATGGLGHDQLRRIRERLEEEDANNTVSVTDLARQQGISVRHFSRLFRESTGKTVSEYAAEIRLNRAKALLSNSDSLIKEIAFECGFQSASSFSSAFRRATKLTPQQFRAARLVD